MLDLRVRGCFAFLGVDADPDDRHTMTVANCIHTPVSASVRISCLHRRLYSQRIDRMYLAISREFVNSTQSSEDYPCRCGARSLHHHKMSAHIHRLVDVHRM